MQIISFRTTCFGFLFSLEDKIFVVVPLCREYSSCLPTISSLSRRMPLEKHRANRHAEQRRRD